MADEDDNIRISQIPRMEEGTEPAFPDSDLVTQSSEYPDAPEINSWTRKDQCDKEGIAKKICKGVWRKKEQIILEENVDDVLGSPRGARQAGSTKAGRGETRTPRNTREKGRARRNNGHVRIAGANPLRLRFALSPEFYRNFFMNHPAMYRCYSCLEEAYRADSTVGGNASVNADHELQQSASASVPMNPMAAPLEECTAIHSQAAEENPEATGKPGASGLGPEMVPEFPTLDEYGQMHPYRSDECTKEGLLEKKEESFTDIAYNTAEDGILPGLDASSVLEEQASMKKTHSTTKQVNTPDHAEIQTGVNTGGKSEHNGNTVAEDAQSKHEGNCMARSTQKPDLATLDDQQVDTRIYDLLETKESTIHGTGVFARDRIESNTFLMRYEGEIIGKSVSDKREKKYKENNISSVYMFKVDEDMIVDATFMGNKARFMNHSCDPNCWTITDTVSQSILYYTQRDISPGEELTIDYRYSEESPDEVCCCGAEDCKSKKRRRG